jgi:hypothetical protein
MTMKCQFALLHAKVCAGATCARLSSRADFGRSSSGCRRRLGLCKTPTATIGETEPFVNKAFGTSFMAGLAGRRRLALPAAVQPHDVEKCREQWWAL